MLKFDETLAGMCGRSITEIRLERHLLGGTETLISVWLAFGVTGLRLRTAGDGWGLSLEGEPPQRSDLGEHGRIEIVNGEGVRGLELGRVESVWSVVSAESPRPIGVRWTVAGMPPVVVYSYDDQFMLEAEPASELGTIRYEPACGPG
jgi:hypothetical protein